MLFCVCIHAFLLGKYQGMELLGHRAGVHLGDSEFSNEFYHSNSYQQVLADYPQLIT